MKIGDIITTYQKGFWRLNKFEDVLCTQADVDYYNKCGKNSFVVGDVKYTLCHYTQICDAKFNFKRNKIEKCCNVSYCKVVDEERLKELKLEKEKQYLDYINNLEEIRKLL